MQEKATFYHAGCPVCVSAEQQVALALDPLRYDLEIVHLGEQKQRVRSAADGGVTSVPALVISGQAFHINFGAALSELG